MGTLFTVLLIGTIYYPKYGIAADKIRHIFILCMERLLVHKQVDWPELRNIKLRYLCSNWYQQLPFWKPRIDWDKGQLFPWSKMPHHDSKNDKGDVKLVTLENVWEFLEDISLDFSKCNKFKAHRQKQNDQDTLFELWEMGKAKIIDQPSG